MSSVKVFLEKFINFSDKLCIIDNGSKYSYSYLINSVNSNYEILLKNNIKSGELVAIIGDYSFNSISIFLALCKNNNILIPITSKNIQEINDRLEEVRPEWIYYLENNTFIRKNGIVYTDRHELIKNVIIKQSAGLILFSSGTTGKPKAMIHDLSNLITTYNDKKSKNIVFLVFLMFDHIGGLNTLFSCLAMGATIVIPSNRTPQHVCKLIEENKINVLPSSPTFLNLILISKEYANYNLSSLKLITYGTEAMPESLLLKLKETFPNVKFLQTFGTSETGIAKTTSKSSTSTFIKIEDNDQEYKIVNNELWLRSKTQILGYINYNNDSFTSDGWFKTGDLVELIEGDFIKIKGRIKEVINVGGEKVTPSEVESTILELSEVLDCVVVGDKNSITGQMVVAKIVLCEDANELLVKKLIKKHCNEKLEKYKVPSKIIFLKQLDFSDRFKKERFNKEN